MVKLKSSIPGMKYPAGRDYFLRTMFGFLEGRRKDDGAENLWRIDDDLYDLEDFIKNHPGGREWLVLTKGTDITEAFQVRLSLYTLEYSIGVWLQKIKNIMH